MRHDPSAFVIPAEFWDRTQVAESLQMRDIGSLFRLVQRYAGASQPGIGMRVGLAQSDIRLCALRLKPCLGDHAVDVVVVTGSGQAGRVAR
ncbi:hypothetical protein BMG523Draft_03300, partial [Frankia sp. BMG5.23]